MTSAFNNLGVTFFAPTDFIGHWCADESLAFKNSTIPTQNASLHLNRYNPVKSSHNVDYQQVLIDFLFSDERKLKHNNMNYDTPSSVREECTYLSPTDNARHDCTSYQYDKGIWLSTIIDEWDLVCDRSWLISLTQSLYMSGFIISYLVNGYISDRFGRWRSLMLGALIEVLSGFGCAFSGSITTFMIFRFLVGLGNAGRSSSSYLIMIEWCGPKSRMHISTLGSIGWVIGYSAMPWISLHYLNFRHMQLFSCFYELIFIIWLLRIPDSPRWLLTHRRFDEAYKVLLMAAKFNGLIKKGNTDDDVNGGVECKNIRLMCEDDFVTTQRMYDVDLQPDEKQSNIVLNAPNIEKCYGTAGVSENPLEPFTLEQFDKKFQHLVNGIQAKEFTKNEDRLSVVDLMRWKNLRRYAFILWFAWAANSFIYYGIVLRVGSFGGSNLFVTFTIAGLTELPSIAFTMLAMKFLPRRTTNIFMFATVGLLCALQAPLRYYDLQSLQQTTIILAKFFNSCSFTCILYQTIELFPTSIRQTAYSSCALAGRIGSILAPFVKELARATNQLVPPALYAALSLFEVILIKRLPETKGSDLTDTLLEAEKFEGTDKLDPASKPNMNTANPKSPFNGRNKSDVV